jgi:hypothetical protein
MASVFFCYSHADENLRDRLEVHLAMLKRQGVITIWHDRRLPPGNNIDQGIRTELERADLVLLLVSPDFLASRYCYEIEMARAMERHRASQGKVLPIILRPCDWKSTPFGMLLATPTDGRPITKFPDYDDAFLEVTNAIKAALDSGPPSAPQARPERLPRAVETSNSVVSPPRSSNLRIRKTFTDAERDQFLDDTFEYMANFFENSLTELMSRHVESKTTFKRIDATQFTATVYRDGSEMSRCRIWFNGSRSFSGGIAYSQNNAIGVNAFNESLQVDEDQEGLFIKPLMAMGPTVKQSTKMTSEGASEYYWSLFIEPLQR